jgi:cell division transport system permease protein
MRFRFVLSEIMVGIKRNLTMVSAVILVTFVSLSAVGAALLLQTQIDKLRGDWSAKAEVSVWLCPVQEPATGECPQGAVTEDQQNAIVERLNSEELAPYVANLMLESREDVFAAFQKEWADDDWVNGVTVDTFPPIIHVKLAQPDDYPVVQEAVKGLPGVYQVHNQSQLLAPLFNVLSKAKWAALGVAAVLMVAAILLITTTIRLSAMSRQKETGIMRLVGASNLFIQLPFMLEGALAALAGSLLAVVTLWALAKFYLARWLTDSFGALMSRVNPADVLVVAPWLIIVAVGLAALASAVTLRRFIKV